jgi:hypothetical protein
MIPEKHLRNLCAANYVPEDQSALMEVLCEIAIQLRRQTELQALYLRHGILIPDRDARRVARIIEECRGITSAEGAAQ